MADLNAKSPERAEQEMSPGIKPEIFSGDMITVFGLRLGVKPVRDIVEMEAKLGLRRSGLNQIEKREKTTVEAISEKTREGNIGPDEILREASGAIETTNTALVDNDALTIEIKNILAKLFNEVSVTGAGQSQKVFEIEDPRELARRHAETFKGNKHNRVGDNIPDMPIEHFFVISVSAGEELKKDLQSFSNEQYKVASDFDGGFIARLNDKAVVFLTAENGKVGGSGAPSAEADPNKQME